MGLGPEEAFAGNLGPVTSSFWASVSSSGKRGAGADTPRDPCLLGGGVLHGVLECRVCDRRLCEHFFFPFIRNAGSPVPSHEGVPLTVPLRGGREDQDGTNSWGERGTAEAGAGIPGFVLTGHRLTQLLKWDVLALAGSSVS